MKSSTTQKVADRCCIYGCEEPAERLIYNSSRVSPRNPHGFPLRVCISHEKDRKYGYGRRVKDGTYE